MITDGVVPSLHVDYKNTSIKQYHKQGRALRTETTINNTRDFGIGKLLKNLPALRQIGFPANRRLLDVQTISRLLHRSGGIHRLTAPVLHLEGTRIPGLRFGDKRVQALFCRSCSSSVSYPVGSPIRKYVRSSRHCWARPRAITPER